MKGTRSPPAVSSNPATSGRSRGERTDGSVPDRVMAAVRRVWHTTNARSSGSCWERGAVTDSKTRADPVLRDGTVAAVVA